MWYGDSMLILSTLTTVFKVTDLNKDCFCKTNKHYGFLLRTKYVFEKYKFVGLY